MGRLRRRREGRGEDAQIGQRRRRSMRGIEREGEGSKLGEGEEGKKRKIASERKGHRWRR